MIRVTRKYRFSASHRLHAPGLTDSQNRELYGKCNNPFGHGHDYEIEVSASGPVDARSGRAVDRQALDRLVGQQVLQRFGNRNLNIEIAAFRSAVPTTENLAREIYRLLEAGWEPVFGAGGPRLDAVRIFETPRNIFEVSKANG